MTEREKALAEALALLLLEVEASGNGSATNDGWPKALAASSAALALPAGAASPRGGGGLEKFECLLQAYGRAVDEGCRSDAISLYDQCVAYVRALAAAPPPPETAPPPVRLIPGERHDQGCFIAEDDAGEKLCRKPTWVCLSHWEEVNRERIRLTNRLAEVEPELERQRERNEILDAEAQRMGRLLAGEAAKPCCGSHGWILMEPPDHKHGRCLGCGTEWPEAPAAVPAKDTLARCAKCHGRQMYQLLDPSEDEVDLSKPVACDQCGRNPRAAPQSTPGGATPGGTGTAPTRFCEKCGYVGPDAKHPWCNYSAPTVEEWIASAEAAPSPSATPTGKEG